MRPKTKAKFIARILSDKKAEDIVIIHIGKVSNIAKYFVICTGATDVHLRAICDEVVDKVGKPYGIEGYNSCNWILLDYIDVIVHIFTKKAREYYNIEILWTAAPIEKYL